MFHSPLLRTCRRPKQSLLWDKEQTLQGFLVDQGAQGKEKKAFLAYILPQASQNHICIWGLMRSTQFYSDFGNIKESLS